MTDKQEQPYLIKTEIVKIKKYNKNYGDDLYCVCGHRYHRHFDSYDNMNVCGCKYCGCNEFMEKNVDI